MVDIPGNVCSVCGGPVPSERQSPGWHRPTCFTCLPPPEPLPVRVVYEMPGETGKAEPWPAGRPSPLNDEELKRLMRELGPADRVDVVSCSGRHNPAARNGIEGACPFAHETAGDLHCEHPNAPPPYDNDIRGLGRERPPWCPLEKAPALVRLKR